MAALEHKVTTLGHEANRLCEIHIDHGDQIKAKQEEIVKCWVELTTKAKVSKFSVLTYHETIANINFII